jgi:hypothetical protein
MVEISPSEVTPEHVFMNRRQFMVGAGSAATVLALAACGAPEAPPVSAAPAVPTLPLDQLPAALANADPAASATTDELGDPLIRLRRSPTITTTMNLAPTSKPSPNSPLIL